MAVSGARPPKKRLPLHTRILTGLLLGGLLGTTLNIVLAPYPDLTRKFHVVLATAVEPVGQVFLRMLFMIVVPLVFTSLILGVASFGDVGRLGRIGIRTILCFLALTTMAATLGLILVDVAKPGLLIDPQTRADLISRYGSEGQVQAGPRFGIDNLVQIVPRNPLDAAAKGDMLALIFFSLICGVALGKIPADKAGPLLSVLEGAGKVVEVIIDLAMRLAPYGVFALILNVTGRFGWGILRQLLYFVVVALGGMILFQFGVYPILVRVISGINPWVFMKRIRSVMITAFSTSSSSATLPTTIRVAQEELGIPREIAGFVLPLGATMNMNGTALFEGVTVIFLAQVWGVHLGLGDQVLIMVLAILTAVGAAGVPGGSIPLLVLILQTVGVPAEGIGLILGVDRILDMSRTVLNVTGDVVTSTVVARLEGKHRQAET